MSRSTRISPLTWIGLVLVLTTTALAAEITYERALLTWKSGLQMVGFSLYHGPLGLLAVLCFYLAIPWGLVVLLMAAIRRRIGSRLNLALVGLYALSAAVLSVPDEVWVRGMAHLAKGRVPQDWLIYAAASGDVGLVNYLVANGADVNVQDSSGQTPLGAAASGGQAEVARMLLSMHARTDTRTALAKETPLLEAAEMNQLDTVAVLLEYGADWSATDVDGRTALDWAIKNGNTTMADLLRNHSGSQ